MGIFPEEIFYRYNKQRKRDGFGIQGSAVIEKRKFKIKKKSK